MELIEDLLQWTVLVLAVLTLCILLILIPYRIECYRPFSKPRSHVAQFYLL